MNSDGLAHCPSSCSGVGTWLPSRLPPPSNEMQFFSIKRHKDGRGHESSAARVKGTEMNKQPSATRAGMRCDLGTLCSIAATATLRPQLSPKLAQNLHITN